MSDYAQYRKILVLHSYHYLYPTKHHKQPEIYAREIGMEMENMNLPDVVVKESPYKRDINELLRRYKSKWFLDLHDPARPYDPSIDEPDVIADLAYDHNHNLRAYLARFLHNNYKKRPHAKFEPFYPVHLFGIPYKNYNHRLLQIELSPWIPKEVSLDFLKRLACFLQSNPFYT